MKRAVCLLVAVLFMMPAIASGQRIHFLLVADTADPKIGNNCKITADNISGALRMLIPANRYTLTAMESDKRRYDADSVLATIDRVGVAGNDTFVFLYDGHGGRANNHHYLHMPGGGRLWSSTLQKTVNRKRCRLRLILTSSCNVNVDQDRAWAPAGRGWNVGQDGIAPVMEELFLNHRGLLHMNSAWPGQFGFTNSRDGSWFFDAFLKYCELCPTGRPTWSCIDRMLDRKLNERFQQTFNGRYVERGVVQTKLNTIHWSLPDGIDHGSSRFGVRGEDHDRRNGVTVLRVAGDGPAGGVLRRGDKIVNINGTKVTDVTTFFDLVRTSPRQMHFEYIRNGSTQRGNSWLRW